MATPFDHMPSYQSLDPDTKDQIMSKFNSLSPNDQQMVMSKANTPMSARGTEGGGVQDISLTPLQQGEFQKTGEDVSARMMTKSMVNANIDPYLAATVGTTIAMIPHVVAAMAGPKGAKAAGEAATTVGDAIAESSVGQAVRGTGKKAVMDLSEKAAELPIKQAQKLQLATNLRSVAKKGIQTAEEQAGIGLTNVQGKSGLLSDAFAVKAAKLADLGAEKLAGAMDSKTLQTMRKTAELGYKEGGANAPLYAKAKKVFTDALGMQQPDIKDALSKYQQIEQVMNDLPDQFKQEKQAFKLALVKARNLAAKQAPIRKGAAIVAGGALAAGGAWEMRNALRKGEQ